MVEQHTPRILHIIDQTLSGGAQVVVGQIMNSLRHSVDSAVVVLGAEGRFSEEYRAAGYQVLGFAKGAKRWSLRPLPSLLSVIRVGRFDIVHTHLLKSMIFGVVAAHICGAKAIIHDHTGIYRESLSDFMTPASLRAAYLAAYRIALRLCDRVIVLTPEMQVGYQRHYLADAHKVRMIANAVDVDRFAQRSPGIEASVREHLGLSADTRLVIMVGRLDPEKDWWMFLRIAGIVRERTAQPCAFLAVGDGVEESALRVHARMRGLDHVHFLGYREDVASLLQAADIFLLTSQREPFGIVIIEAMAAGCPVVAVRSGGPESIITDGYDGMFAPARNAESIASCILELLADPGKRTQIGQHARVTVEQRYGLAHMAYHISCLYTDLARQ